MTTITIEEPDVPQRVPVSSEDSDCDEASATKKPCLYCKKKRIKFETYPCQHPGGKKGYFFRFFALIF